MPKIYIKKEGTAVINIARYLMSLKEGARLRTIDSLAEEFGLSVGLVQKALKKIEADGVIALSRQGRNGTYISRLDSEEIVRLAGLGNVVCAMPLPYTKHYEGLASGLKVQMGRLPLYFAHMRGAGVRAKLLSSGVHDIAIMSKLAAQNYSDGLTVAVNLGKNSYSNDHRMIYRKGEYGAIRRIGVDPDSPDQQILTKQAFPDQDIEIIEINYGDSLAHLASRDIDAVIWLTEAIDMDKFGLEEKSLSHLPECEMASEAVLLVRNEAVYIKTLLRNLIDRDALITHQKKVVAGEITPSY
ncbi:GntR family transcriptional regulator YhfZ [Photobacterium sp.]|uniref:GntR family transcriptional regulator YhfZ n=1 Tax=Photobacterium sp. TaxID=660 RepID=UPI00299E41D3|nr:GntR family transcriptional regulator YhfZ [Photobacterium sp.]MDX1303059.1 GntR family transcriptional regulator YhfZ [Photobacterium sp.]